MADTHTLMFGPFRLDLRSERLWRGEEALRLTNKAFAVLRYLLEHAEQLVTKDVLFEVVWPDTYVGDATLAMCIRELWQQREKRKEAQQLLSEIYYWFTEGFDTADLQEAKVLLKELEE